ncbi:RNA polymerase sigma factor [Myxococcota bacterium]|nr:RNA polymerase sigma factor [Myxococcota bacterium]
MANPDDRELVQRILEGDEKACDLFARRWFVPCYAVALAIVRHVEDAQDIAQESLIKALRRLPQLSDPAAPGPWIHAIARNSALTHLSRRKRRGLSVEFDAVTPIPAPAEPGAPEHAGTGDAQRLVHALGVLKEPERQVVLLHDLDGLQHAEIARFLGITETNSRQLLFVARRKMRAVLQPEEATP